jgi:hypothetical protein
LARFGPAIHDLLREIKQVVDGLPPQAMTNELPPKSHLLRRLVLYRPAQTLTHPALYRHGRAWPGLARPSTTFLVKSVKSWMACLPQAMTKEEPPMSHLLSRLVLHTLNTDYTKGESNGAKRPITLSPRNPWQIRAIRVVSYLLTRPTPPFISG